MITYLTVDHGNLITDALYDQAHHEAVRQVIEAMTGLHVVNWAVVTNPEPEKLGDDAISVIVAGGMEIYLFEDVAEKVLELESEELELDDLIGFLNDLGYRFDTASSTIVQP